MKIIKDKNTLDLAIRYCGLGDTWRSLSYINYKYPNTNINLMILDRPEYAKRVKEFLKYTKNNIPSINLRYKSCEAEILKTNFQIIDPNYMDHFEYTKTIIDWKPQKNKVCLHLDGLSWPRNKKPNKNQKLKIIEILDGYDIEYMRGDTDLLENIKRMSQCEFFIGTDSGFSHISHSVGIKSFILKCKMPLRVIKAYHKHTDYTLIENVEDLRKYI